MESENQIDNSENSSEKDKIDFSYRRFIGNLLKETPEEDWEESVWPKAQEFHISHNGKKDSPALLDEYNWLKNRVREINKNKEETSGYLPAIKHAELMSKEFLPARYTIEPFFEQGTLNMLSAPPNTWKSWLFFLFAGHIVSGTSVFNKFETEKAKVMIVNEEDSSRLVQDRLRLLNIKDESLPIYYRIAQGSKLTYDFVDNLIKECKHRSIGVVMFDSLRAIHDADENDSTAMQGVMDLLKKISRENITVVFTHHHRKKSMFSRNESAESSRGSSAINAAISGHLSLEEVSKDGEVYLVVKHLKSKVGEKLPPFDLSIEKGEIIDFKYIGEHQPKEQALTEARGRIITELEERKQLLGRKDFEYLKVGGKTTIKEATNFLEKEGKIKMIIRKDAEKVGMDLFNKEGKPNEKLYYIKGENDEPEPSLDLFDDR